MMSQALELVNLTESTIPVGSVLAKVDETPNTALHLDEKVAVREAASLTPIKPDYVFFRRFGNNQSSQVAAYVIDNTSGSHSASQIYETHRNIWLSGRTPLLYVESNGRIDIYSCAKAAEIKGNEWKPSPVETIEIAEDINKTKAKASRFSAYRLVDGTFWEDKRNAELVNPTKSAHRALISKVEYADKELEGSKNPAARHLLLLTLLLKYLEDREVFPEGWFSQFHPGGSCLHVFKHGGKEAVLRMLKELEDKFNGDIFRLSQEHIDIIDDKLLSELTDLICSNLDSRSRQFYLWDFYSFKYIPVEVLSHIYQRFADREKGAIFTPLMLVNLMLDVAMPLNTLHGDETILDPTCGSGVFLVAAFRRLVHVWCEANHWKRPSAKELTDLLSKTIFGIELQQQASELACFSLALAVCDALQPNVIWKELRFDNLLNKNIFHGDYCKYIENAKSRTKDGAGFDIVVGNPPFMSKLSAEMEKRSSDCHIPNKQTAYFFLRDCATKALRPSGRICLLQVQGLLYSEKTSKFRSEFFSDIKVDCVLDFVSIRGLFQGANTQVVAILAVNEIPSDNHSIRHWTFRRTMAADKLINFDLDYYDYHTVNQEIALSCDWIWRVNLLGGGRLCRIAERLSEYPTIEEIIKNNNWFVGEGFKDANNDRGQLTPVWMTGKTLLPAKAFTKNGIVRDKLSKVEFTYCNSPRTEKLYQSPLVLIKEHDTLPCCFWDECFIVFPDGIIGITCSQDDNVKLNDFAEKFIKNKAILRPSCYLLGSRILNNRATSLNKTEIMRLPWPEDGNYDLSVWEQEMLDDINDFMPDYVRKGQDSALLTQTMNDINRKLYVGTFLDSMRHIYPEIKDAGYGRSNGLAFQAFKFEDGEDIDWFDQDWISHVRNDLLSSKSVSGSYTSTRILRIYDRNTLILVKPDRLRYWIRSIALRDVDDVLHDMLTGDEANA